MLGPDPSCGDYARLPASGAHQLMNPRTWRISVVACACLGSVGENVVVVRDPKHYRDGLDIMHRGRQYAHLC
jgi:hypothetical protein